MEEGDNTKEKEEVGDCQVCEQPGHGIHFGILSCRACAAFFRRTIVHSRQYPCRKGDDRCLIEKGSRIICRKCRYAKCVRLGMTPDNVQYNRDRMKPCSSKGSKGKDVELPTDIPQPSPPKTIRLESLMTPIDRTGSDDLIERFEKFVATFNPELDLPGVWEQRPLNRMYMALLRHRRDQVTNAQDLHILTEINIREMKNNWETTMFKVAEWHLYCKEFYMLPFKEQLIIFQDRWKTFMRLERLLMSVEFFGPAVLQEKIMLFGNNCAAYVKHVKIDLSSVSDHDPEKIRGFFEPIIENTFEKIITPLLQLRLAPMEAVYLLCQLAFTVEGLDLPYETIDSFISFRDQISDDLHNYYASIGLTNYASRLMDILAIVQSMESVQSQREQLMELIKIFDYIKLEDNAVPCFKDAAKRYVENT